MATTPACRATARRWQVRGALKCATKRAGSALKNLTCRWRRAAVEKQLSVWASTLPINIRKSAGQYHLPTGKRTLGRGSYHFHVPPDRCYGAFQNLKHMRESLLQTIARPAGMVASAGSGRAGGARSARCSFRMYHAIACMCVCVHVCVAELPFANLPPIREPTRAPLHAAVRNSLAVLLDDSRPGGFSMRAYGNVRWDVFPLQTAADTHTHTHIHADAGDHTHTQKGAQTDDAAHVAAVEHAREYLSLHTSRELGCFVPGRSRSAALTYSTDGVAASHVYVDERVKERIPPGSGVAPQPSGQQVAAPAGSGGLAPGSDPEVPEGEGGHANAVDNDGGRPWLPAYDEIRPRAHTLSLGHVTAVVLNELVECGGHGVAGVDVGVLANHTVYVCTGVRGDMSVATHTHSQAAETAAHVPQRTEAAVEPDGTTTSSGTVIPGSKQRLRVLSLNVWNVNPPTWLWRDKRDRFRQYTLRMYHLADVVREVSPDIMAFQEVRYDSSLGGFDDPAHEHHPYPPRDRFSAPYTYRFAFLIASDWYNRTRKFAVHEKYVDRNSHKWQAVKNAASFRKLVSMHGVEGPSGVITSKQVNASMLTTSTGDDFDVEQLPGPYKRGAGAGPTSFDRVERAFRRQPHAQIQHLSSHFPEYQYVYQPAQLYVDAEQWVSTPHRDEEGPAIFSRFPIVHSDFVLLSRDPNDEGDGHQRLCLHATIDTPGSGPVDVYSVHLPLSETARNRVVPELLAFIQDSARGKLQVLAGDMNAEPHEPAMRMLREAGVHLMHQRDRDMEQDSWSQYMESSMALYAEAALPQAAPAPASAAAQAAALDRRVTAPKLEDAWLLSHDEPRPRDDDAAQRRYALTFPSDDPIKRIDLVMLASPAGRVCAANAASSGADCAVAVTSTFLVGQDPLPATDLYEGKGVGMVHESSPIYASDHRGVVVDLRV